MARAKKFKGRGWQLKLAQLPKDVSAGIVASSVLDNAETIREDAEKYAPRRSGTLAKNIINILEFSSPLEARARVGPRKGKGKNDVYYAPWAEFGTVHSAPRPYMRPAYDLNINAVLNKIGLDIATRTIKALSLQDTRIK